MKMHHSFIGLFLALAAIVAEAGVARNTGAGPNNYEDSGPGLILASPLLDPAIPPPPPATRGSSGGKKKESVWPEIRRAEAVRNALKIRDAIEKTKVFSDVLVVSRDTDAAINGGADLFLFGTIDKSDGEDLHISVELRDIAGHQWLMKKSIRHRATDEWHAKSSSSNADPFEAVFVAIADLVAQTVVRKGKMHAKVAARNQRYIERGQENRVKLSKLEKLVMVRQLLFAGMLSPDLYADALTKKNNKWKITYLPLTDTEEWKRVQALKTADDVYLQASMRSYRRVAEDIETVYAPWQRAVYPIAKEARKKRSEAQFKQIGGLLLAIGGGAAAISGGSDAAQVLGAVLAAGGLTAMVSASKESEKYKRQIARLDELGSSIQSAIAPKLIELQDRQIKLTGTAAEQQEQWRLLMKQFYDDSTVDLEAIVISQDETA